jgi:membrane-anchored glycerophosphoryl diester phosphodiesterase (GDPDase)
MAVMVVIYLISMGGILFSVFSKESLEYVNDPFAIYSSMSSLQFIIEILFLFLGFYFGIGFCRMSIRAVDGETPGVSAFKIPFTMFLNTFVGELLVCILCSIGIFLCIIPGIYLIIRLMFTPYYIIDQGCGPIEGISRSWEKTKGNELDLFLFLLVLMLINVIGALLCGIGLLITYPVTYVAVALAYRRGTTNPFQRPDEDHDLKRSY